MAPSRLNASTLADQVTAQLNAAIPDLIAQVIAGINERIFGDVNPYASHPEINVGNSPPLPATVKLEKEGGSQINSPLSSPVPVPRKKERKRKTSYQPIVNDRNKRPAIRHQGYAGSHPKCDKCYLHHFGGCPSCFLCHQTGHLYRRCRKYAPNPGRRWITPQSGSNGHPSVNCPVSRVAEAFGALTITAKESKQDSGPAGKPPSKQSELSLRYSLRELEGALYS